MFFGASMGLKPFFWKGGKGGGVMCFFLVIYTPKLVEDEPILNHIGQRGWFNHQLVVLFDVLYLHPYLGMMIQLDHYCFQMG